MTLGEDTAIINALIGGQLDLLNGIVFANSRALFNNSNIKIFTARGATHREIPMRVDQPAACSTTSACARRSRSRSTGRRSSRRCSTTSPTSATTRRSRRSTPRRARCRSATRTSRKAKELIAAAGLKPGWKTKLVTYQTAELPQLAQIVKQAVKAIGGNINVKILTGTQYYSGSPTQTPWLNKPMTITDWGHRGVPNVLLNAALTSKAVPSKKAGTWNAAHFKNKKYDSLVKSFGAAVSLADQRKYREADRAAAARPDARDLPVLLQLAQRGQPEGRRATLVDQLGSDLPEQDVALLSGRSDDRPDGRRAHCAAAVGVLSRRRRPASVRESPTRC